MKAIKDYIEKMQEESNNIKNKQIIDDIIAISKGLYDTYDDYVKHKENIVKIIREHNKLCFLQYNEEHRFTCYAEPVILNENDFNYIVSEYLDKMVILCKIR